MIMIFGRNNMFTRLIRGSFAKRLLDTKGEDFSVVEDQINHVLRVERWKRRFRQYFPRLSVNVFVNRIVKPDPESSEVVEKFAEQSLEARKPEFTNK